MDARTDLFSFDVLIYEMVAGRLPFEGSNINEILAWILSDKVPLPLARCRFILQSSLLTRRGVFSSSVLQKPQKADHLIDAHPNHSDLRE